MWSSQGKGMGNEPHWKSNNMLAESCERNSQQITLYSLQDSFAGISFLCHSFSSSLLMI